MATLLRGTVVGAPLSARATETMATLLRERGVVPPPVPPSAPRALGQRLPLAPEPSQPRRTRRGPPAPPRRPPPADVDRVLAGDPPAPPARPAKAQKPRARTGAASRPVNAAAPAPPPLLGRALGPARLLLVGGRVQAEKLARLQARFGDRVAWIATEGRDRSLRALERRIHDGGVVGLVLLEGVAKHQHTEPLVRAARAASVPHAFAGTGGHGAVERAIVQIERALGRKGQLK